MNTKTATGVDAREIVLNFIDALNNEDFDAARACLDENMSFLGVLGTREGAGNYISDMSRMKFKYDIKKVFVDDSDVCLWYDINMGEKTILTSGWYHVENGKIRTLRVVFDPRPVL